MEIDRRRLFALGGAATAAALLPSRLFGAAIPRGIVEAARAKHNAPAAAGMIVTGSEIPFLEVAGVRRAGTNDRVTTTDQWHIGSLTKAMTAALYGKLVEAGFAKWDATVPDLFPDLAGKLDPAWKDIRIEQLMSHSAGIDDEKLNMLDWWVANLGRRPVESLPPERTNVAARIFGKPPNAKVGQFLYSNAGYLLAGAAIERAVKQPWETAIAERLFRPLGLGSAGFGAPLGSNPWGHKYEKNAMVAVDPNDPQADIPPAAGPAGSVHLTLQDYAKWLRVFLAKGGDFLKLETFQKLTTPAVTEPRSYGLGWLVEKTPALLGTILDHEGSNELWHMVVFVSPELGFATVGVSNNEAPAGATASKEIALQLLLAAKDLGR